MQGGNTAAPRTSVQACAGPARPVHRRRRGQLLQRGHLSPSSEGVKQKVGVHRSSWRGITATPCTRADGKGQGRKTLKTGMVAFNPLRGHPSRQVRAGKHQVPVVTGGSFWAVLRDGVCRRGAGPGRNLCTHAVVETHVPLPNACSYTWGWFRAAPRIARQPGLSKPPLSREEAEDLLQTWLRAERRKGGSGWAPILPCLFLFLFLFFVLVDLRCASAGYDWGTS